MVGIIAGLARLVVSLQEDVSSGETAGPESSLVLRAGL